MEGAFISVCVTLAAIGGVVGGARAVHDFWHWFKSRKLYHVITEEKIH